MNLITIYMVNYIISHQELTSSQIKITSPKETCYDCNPFIFLCCGGLQREICFLCLYIVASLFYVEYCTISTYLYHTCYLTRRNRLIFYFTMGVLMSIIVMKFFNMSSL